MAELKQRRLPTFGTGAERRDRLRKFHGLPPAGTGYQSNIGGGGESSTAAATGN